MAFTGKLGHLEIESPWGNAGGVVKTIDEVEQMARTGVGWIEAGSYTLEPRVGNSPNGEVVYYHNDETGETFNSLGMPNKGMDALEEQIPEMVKIAKDLGKSIIFNVAPVSEDPVNESKELITRAYEAGAEAVLLNAGCPNVITKDGGRHELLSHNPETLREVLIELRPLVDKYNPVFVRTSPAKDVNQARDTYKAIADSHAVSTVFTPNTWPGHKPLDEDNNPILEVKGNIGGLSGPAATDKAAQQTAWAFIRLRRSNIQTVASAGIMNGQELNRRIKMGAVAGCGTTLYYQSAHEKRTWEEATDRLLQQYADTL